MQFAARLHPEVRAFELVCPVLQDVRGVPRHGL